MDWIETMDTRLGKGTRFIANLRRSLNMNIHEHYHFIQKEKISHPFSCPGNRKLVDTPAMTVAITWLRFRNSGVLYPNRPDISYLNFDEYKL